MRTVTLLVTGPSEPANLVGETLLSWVEAGLLRPSLWLHRDTHDGGRPDLLRALRLQVGHSEDVPLLDELALLDVDLVRLVSVHLAIDAKGDPALSHDVEAIASTLTAFLSPSQSFERVNIIVPTTGLTGLDRLLVHHPGVKHVLVSPEDRVTDLRTSRSVAGADDAYAGHAALAVATIAGLWWATESAPFDQRSFTSSAERSQIVVTRSFARVLRAAELGERVTEEVFERRRTEAWTAAAVDATAAANPGQMIEDLADRLGTVENGALNYTPTAGLPTPKRQSVGIFQAFRMMFQFIIGKLRDVPSQVAGRVSASVRRSVENFAQNVVFGQDSLMQVGAGGRTSLDGTERSPAEAAIAYATRLLRDMGASTSPPAVAGLWEALRRISFGVIDAGPFPEGIEVPKDGARRLVVNEIRHVVADPGDVFELNRKVLGVAHPLPAWAFEPVPAWDVRRIRDLRELLAEMHHLAQDGRQEQELEDGSIGPAVEPDEALAARLESLLLALDAFVARHETSLIWRVASRLDAGLRQASQSFLQAVGTVRRGEPSENDDKMRLAAKWLRRRWLLWFLVALAVPGAALYAEDQGWWDPIWWAVGVTAVLVWLVGWFLSFLTYQRRVFQIQYEVDRRHRDYLESIVRAEHDAKETIRLASLYDQFLDWAAIIAWMVHHPGGVVRRGDDHPLAHPEGQPLAMRVAEGVPSEQTLQRTSAIVGRGVFSRGWIGNLYQSYARASIDGLKHQLGLPDEAPDPDPDRDLATPAPRTFVRDQIASGAHAASWHERVRAQVDHALGALPPDELFSSIETREGSATDQTASAFLSEALPDPTAGGVQLLPQVWRPHAMFDRPQEVQSITVWAPGRLAAGADVSAEVRDSAPADEAVSGAFVLALIRCDASGGCSVDDLSVFHSAPEDPVLPSEPIDPGIG